MTATATPAATPALPLPPASLARRLGRIARLHVANPFTLFGTPLLVLAVIFAVNWTIWWVIRSVTPGDPQSIQDVSEGFQYSGASLWVFVYMMVVAIQAMNLTFPFALGLGSTRRDFLAGSLLTFLGLSVAWALLYVVLAAIEEATGGWGMGGAMFSSIFFGVDVAWGVRLFHLFALLVFFFSLGSAFGAMYVRWRARGLILFFSLLALVLTAAVALVTATASWPAIGEAIGALGLTGAYASSLGVSVVAAVAAYLILRRATPRS